MFEKLFKLFFLFAIFYLADQYVELANENGITKTNNLPFSVVDQCYGPMGEEAPGSYRLQFSVEGNGHCQLLFCYPSQLDPRLVKDGMALEMGYQLGNLKGNIVAEQCLARQKSAGPSELLHGIYVDSDSSSNHITLSLSFSNQSFHIDGQQFILELGNPHSPSMTLIYVEKEGEFVLKIFENDEQIRRQFFADQHRGALIKDSAGLWTLAMDMLPSDWQQGQIQIFTMGDQHNKQVTCNIDRGETIDDNCSIIAKTNKHHKHIVLSLLNMLGKNIKQDVHPNMFLNPTEKAEVQVPINPPDFNIEKLPYLIELPKLKMDSIIHITGHVTNNTKEAGSLYVYLLHNWKEPDSIMGETILRIQIRPGYINFDSRYNFTEDKHNYILNEDKKIQQNFSINIANKANGIYSVVLNCDNKNAYKFEQKIPLPPLEYTATDYILIERDTKSSGMSLGMLGKPKIFIPESSQNGKNPPNAMAQIPDPSYSLKLDLANFDHDIFIIVRMELPKNAIKFDINLVRHDKKDEGAILAHFHANLIGQYYVLGRCQKTCNEWTDTKTIDASADGRMPMLKAGQKFVWMFAQLNKAPDQIYINGIRLNQMQKMDKPNYIQFKGDAIMVNIIIKDYYPFMHKYSLESAFKPFNEISILVKLVPAYNIFKIRFYCVEEKKCGKALSNNSMELIYSDNKTTMVYKNESVSKEFNLPVNKTFELRIYANQYEYQIYWEEKRILTANFWQFPTPDQIDTVKIDGLYFQTEGKPLAQKEWKQYDSDITIKKKLPFVYRLDKTLEIGSKFQIKIDKLKKDNWEGTINLLHDAKAREWQFHSNVLNLNIQQKNGEFRLGDEILDTQDPNFHEIYNYYNLKGYDFSKIVQFEIVIHVHREYYQILLDGKHLVNITYVLPVWMVDFMSIAWAFTGTEFKLLEAKITWPSDSSENWLEPSNILLRQTNSFKFDLANAKTVNLEIQMAANSENISVFFMTRCQQERVYEHEEMYKEACVASFSFEFLFKSGKITENYNGLKLTNGTMKSDANSSFFLKLNRTFSNGIENIEIWNTFHENGPAIGKIEFPFLDNVNFIQIIGNGSIKKAEIESEKFLGLPKGVPFVIKLARPLRVNDTISVKGTLMELAEPKNFIIRLLRDIPPTTIGFRILEVDINYEFNKGSKSTLKTRRDGLEGGSEPPSQVEFTLNAAKIDLTIRVNEDKFSIENAGTDMRTFDASHENLFWAVQYIKFVFEKGSEKQNIEIDEGYPKIGHQYP